MTEPRRGLPPVIGAAARILVLGSFPGEESLRRREYYGHPRNQFWPIMGALVGAGPELAYAERLRRLMAAGIALWDVLDSCRREGSLDQRIETQARRPNDLAALAAGHPGLRHVVLNGTMAAALYTRLPPDRHPGLPATALPSTSPAHARLRPAEKLERWRVVLAPLLAPQISTCVPSSTTRPGGMRK